MSVVSPLQVLKSLLGELRYASSSGRLQSNLLVRYIVQQYRKHQVTDMQLCKAREELLYLAQTYNCYLSSLRRYEEIHETYHAKGERSVKETADMVGFKLPHDPK